MREVALPDPLGAGEQLVHRAGDRPGERESHDHGRRLDGQEHHAEPQQHPHEDVDGELASLDDLAVEHHGMHGEAHYAAPPPARGPVEEIDTGPPGHIEGRGAVGSRRPEREPERFERGGGGARLRTGGAGPGDGRGDAEIGERDAPGGLHAPGDLSRDGKIGDHRIDRTVLVEPLHAARHHRPARPAARHDEPAGIAGGTVGSVGEPAGIGEGAVGSVGEPAGIGEDAVGSLARPARIGRGAEPGGKPQIARVVTPRPGAGDAVAARLAPQHRDGGVGIALLDGLQPARQHRPHLRRLDEAAQVDGGHGREVARVLHHVREAELHERRADGRQQQPARHQEEHDREQDRHEADQDVGQHEPPPDPPQEALLQPVQHPHEQVAESGHQGQGPRRIQDPQPPRAGSAEQRDQRLEPEDRENGETRRGRREELRHLAERVDGRPQASASAAGSTGRSGRRGRRWSGGALGKAGRRRLRSHGRAVPMLAERESGHAESGPTDGSPVASATQARYRGSPSTTGNTTSSGVS